MLFVKCSVTCFVTLFFVMVIVAITVGFVSLFCDCGLRARLFDSLVNFIEVFSGLVVLFVLFGVLK